MYSWLGIVSRCSAPVSSPFLSKSSALSEWVFYPVTRIPASPPDEDSGGHLRGDRRETRPWIRRPLCVKAWSLILLCSSSILSAQAPTYEDPSTRELPAHIGRTFLRMFHTDSIVPLLIGGAATGVAGVSKQEVASYFGQTRRFREFGQAGHIIGSPAVVAGVAGGLYIAGRRSDDPRFRAMTYSLVQANILTSAVTMGAKYAVGRERPNQQARDSFFSGHTSAGFATAAVLSEYYGTKAAVASYTVATLVGLSRIEKNKHRMTDLTVGATVGYIIGKAAVRSQNRGRPPRYSVGVAPLPGGGAALHVGIRAGRF
jgi:membrane-associated phospholipid phosphatase